MDVEVTTPQDHVGDVVGVLNRRRGQIQNQESSGSTVLVRAQAPLKEMFGYISHLRSMTKGPRLVHHAVPSLRSGAAKHRRRDHGEVRVAGGCWLRGAALAWLQKTRLSLRSVTPTRVILVPSERLTSVPPALMLTFASAGA